MSEYLGKEDRCSIARAIDLLGDKWVLLIVREAFWGRSRFSEFRDSLGIAPNILSDRLAGLVHEGVLETRAYRQQGSRERNEYLLTDKGRELHFVIASLAGWGRQNRPLEDNRTPSYTDAESGEPVELSFVTATGKRVSLDQLDVRPAP